MQGQLRWRNFYSRYGLAVCGVIWLTFIKFHKLENLRRRYGRNLAEMSIAMCKRISRDGSSIPGRNQQIFLSQGVNAFSSESHYGPWRRNPRASFLLFMANTFKTAGMFDVASVAYDMALQTGYKADVVLTGLADLHIIEAGWTVEAQAHLEAGILLDEKLAPCLRFRTQAWTHRSFSDAIAELQKATKLNPDNKSAWWLLSETLIKKGEWENSLHALQTYLRLAPPYYEQNMALAIGEFGRDPANGKMILEKQLTRWKGWMKASVVHATDQLAAANIPGVEQRKLSEGTTLTLKSHVVAGGELCYYERLLIFNEVFAYKLQEAEVLPHYGMTIAMGNRLLADTTHISLVHWRRYTPSILTITKDAVLVCREAAREIETEDAIYFGHNANYYHFICEDLPRLLLFEQDAGVQERMLLVSLDIKDWQQQLLVRFGFDPSRWTAVDFNSPLRFRQLNIPAVASRDLLANPVAINLLRKHIFSEGEKKSKRGKRLYLTRGIGGSRDAHFLNEGAIIRRLTAAGFEVVNTGSMSIDSQIELFLDAEIVAGPAGAAFANLVFAPGACKALIFASSADAGEAFSSLASAAGQDYFICVGDGHPRPDVSWIHTSFDFTIDLADVDVALEGIRAKLDRI